MSTQSPILVVGAGPTGLIFTLCMLKNAVPVRLIECDAVFRGSARGTALQPRTLEALAFLGVLDDVLEIDTGPLLMASYGPDGRTARYIKWAEEARKSPGVPYPSVASTSQASVEGILRVHIQKLGGNIETGVELVGLEQDADKVTARLLRHDTGQEEEMKCAFVVGADGAKGRTRGLAGIAFLGETKEGERLLSANVYATGADRESWNMWGNFGTAGIGLKPLKPEPLFQLQALGPNLPAVLPTELEGTRELFYSISGRTDIEIHAVNWASEWRANIRMAEKFSAGRVFLIGDAAHCHSPFGGQGLNSGVQDAVNLAWKLALVSRARASPELLATYDAERTPVIAEMLDLSTALHSRAYGRHKASALEGSSGNVGADVDMEAVMFRPKRLLQLGVNYRWSPVVLEGRAQEAGEPATARNPYGQDSQRVRAGDRAPDAPGLVEVPSAQPVTLFSLFDVRRHTILAFDHEVDKIRSEANFRGLSEYQRSGLSQVVRILPQHTASGVSDVQGRDVRVFVDDEGHAWREYGIGETEAVTDLRAADTFVVIRPDGVIGAFALSIDDVHRYFSKILA